MINKIVVYAQHRSTKKLMTLFKRYSSYEVQTDLIPKAVKNSLVFVDYFKREFLTFDHSNLLILLTRSSELNKLLILAPKADLIIADSYTNAFSIELTLNSKGIKGKTSSLTPFAEPSGSLLHDYYSIKIDKRFENVTNRYQTQNDPRSRVCFYLSDDPPTHDQYYSILESMTNGSVPIVSNHFIFQEIIQDNYNGYLINSPNHLLNVLHQLPSNLGRISTNAKLTYKSKFDPNFYLNQILNHELLPKIKFKTNNLKSSKWVVRSRIFKGGKVHYFPEINNNHKLIEFNDLEEMLGYFVSKDFDHIYVFNKDLTEETGKNSQVNCLHFLNLMGNKSYRIHFCIDEEIPSSMDKIFSKLSVVSVDEGLKQISAGI